MIYVGIDVAKETHYTTVMDSDGVVHVKPFAFSNDALGFSKLTDKLFYPIHLKNQFKKLYLVCIIQTNFLNLLSINENSL